MVGKIRGQAVILGLKMVTEKGFGVDIMVGLREIKNAIFPLYMEKKISFIGVKKSKYFRKSCKLVGTRNCQSHKIR